jgi:hypothetical protein
LVARRRWRCVRLPAYFCGFHPGDDWLLIASGTNITSVDQTFDVTWRSAPLGIDGVMIERVAAGVISGQGEWESARRLARIPNIIGPTAERFNNARAVFGQRSPARRVLTKTCD